MELENIVQTYKQEFKSRQLLLQRGKAFLHEVPIPVLEENNILVQVAYSFISSGTELATLKNSEKSLASKISKNYQDSLNKVSNAIKENGVLGTLALIKEKKDYINSIGYSCSGQVVDVGKKVEKFKVGDYVACAGSGYANHADIISIPVNLAVKVSDQSLLKEASLTTIGSIAMQGIRRANLKLGEKVCVLGLGLIGQITAQLAKLNGCKVFGLDLENDRLKLAKRLGSDHVFNPELVNIEKEIDFATEHRGVDVTIITAASPSGGVIDLAMNITRRKGRVVLVGDVKLDFSRQAFYSKEIDFLISCSYGPGRYDSSYEKDGKDYPYSYVPWTENRNMELFVDLIEKKKLSIEPLISQVFDFDYAEKAYDFLKKEKALGAVLSYGNKEQYNFLQKLTEHLSSESNDNFWLNELEGGQYLNASSYIPPKGKLQVGFIGVGGFAKIKLLPLLSKNRKVKLHSMIDTSVINLINIAKVYDAKRIGSNYKSIITDDDINLVVIATPHRFHLEHSLAALKNGKAVFVEKPACVSFEQLNLLKKFLKKNDNSFYCVDFNRSFAPFNIAIKKELKKRNSPLIIHYRMNVGFIPKDHWIQCPRQGGRIIGEACHIFELFCFLTDAKPISIAVESLNHGKDDLLSNDNLTVSLRMDDGSCCSFVYTSLGNSAMGKERMEIFFDGKSIVMQDYLQLNGYGLPSGFNSKVNYADKGHENLLFEFIKRAKTPNAKPPIPIQRILIATELSLIADSLALQGGGFKHIL